jgi:hypothetical protein
MTTCSAQIKVDDWHWGKCSKEATIERDGKWYCGRHDPVKVQARRDKSHAKYEAKQNANRCKKDGCGYVFKTTCYEGMYKFCPFCGTPR